MVKNDSFIKKRVLVFARRPRPGRVKMRLAKDVGEEPSSAIYEQLLLRNISEIEKLENVELWILVAEKGDVRWFEQKFGAGGWKISFQGDGDIGDRMLNAFERFSSPNMSTVVVGSDIADMCFEDIENAFNLLKEKVCVIGPSKDGGYWLIGMNSSIPTVFQDISWSSSSVFENTLCRIEEALIEPKLLPFRTDIDEIDDLLDLLLIS